VGGKELRDQGLDVDGALEGWIAPRAPSGWNPLADAIRDDLCAEVPKSRPAAQCGPLRRGRPGLVQSFMAAGHDEPDGALNLWSSV
jgi:hypothetical protein